MCYNEIGDIVAYMKFKEIAKSFDFQQALNKEELPGYIKHYIPEDEIILIAYKTSRDHGVFTDRKVVLFDHVNSGGKQIYTVPYSSISVLSIVFEEKSAELHLSLIGGVPLKLTFISLKPEDKVRLRLLYTCINRIINHQEPIEKDIRRLMSDDVKVN